MEKGDEDKQANIGRGRGRGHVSDAEDNATSISSSSDKRTVATGSHPDEASGKRIVGDFGME